MTQQTGIRMNGEEEEKKDKMKKDRRRRSSSRTEAKRTDLETVDNRVQQVKGHESRSKVGTIFGGSSPTPDVGTDIPLVRIHQATPSPRPLDQSNDVEGERKKRRKRKKSERREKTDGAEEGLEDEDKSASDENEEEEDEEEEDVEDEEEDEEEGETEMTQEEKKAMYEAVIEGDIDVLEDCLDLPNSDINMIWFQENLLMAAIRAGHVDVAEFLLDNGVDSTFSTSVVDVQETPDGKVMERYEVDCRQMAYDRHLQDVVFLIDFLQDNLFPFIPRPVRTPRLRRPKPEFSDVGDTDDDDDEDDDDDDDADDESQSGSSNISGSLSDLGRKEEDGTNTPLSEGNQLTMKKKKKKRKRKKKEEKKKRSSPNSAADDDGVIADNNTNNDDDDDGKRTARADDDDDDDEEDGDKDKTFRTGSTSRDMDSGNYSMASSKLKKSMLQKHDKLLEKEERRGSTSADSRRKSESESTQTKSQSQKSKGDKTDRTSTTTLTQERDQSSSGPDESGALSRSIIPEIPEWAAVLNPPTNRIRSTKAAVAAKQGNLARNFYRSPLHASTTERPLTWRKISTPGSYARESKRWHLENKIEETNAGKVNISQLSITPLFPPSSSVPTSIPVLSSSASFSSKSPKSQRLSSTPSDISESMSLASLSIQDRVDRFKSPKSIPKSTSPTVSETASYMRPTQSTMTKQRLGTQFVNSYGGLGFCPNPSRSTNFHMGETRTPGKLQINGTAAVGTLSRSHRVPVLAAKSVVQRRNENVISYRR